jgi:hypothetical protein
MMLYVLYDAYEPRLVFNEAIWDEWACQEQQRGRVETIGDMDVRTCFLGIDLQGEAGPPILFSTMIFEPGRKCCYRRHAAT